MTRAFVPCLSCGMGYSVEQWLLGRRGCSGNMAHEGDVLRQLALATRQLGVIFSPCRGETMLRGEAPSSSIAHELAGLPGKQDLWSLVLLLLEAVSSGVDLQGDQAPSPWMVSTGRLAGSRCVSGPKRTGGEEPGDSTEGGRPVGGCVQVLEGHADEVWAGGFSSDGRHVLSAGDDFMVLLWEAATGRCLRTFQGHTSQVRSVCFSPDDRHALSGDRDGRLLLWDVAGGRCLRALEGHTGGVTSVSISPDGRLALSGSEDRTLRLWDLTTGECLRTFRGHTGTVTSVTFGPDGRLVLSGSTDKTVRLWETATGKCRHTYFGHTQYVTAVAVSADGCLLLSASGDQTLRLWDLSTGQGLRTFDGHTGYFRSVSISTDGRRVISGGADGAVRLWDVASGQCLGTLAGHMGPVRCVSLSPDGRFALSASGDRTVRLWRLDREEEEGQPADWDEGARVYLRHFLTLHTRYTGSFFGLFTRARVRWSEEDFQRLLFRLACAGHRWLRPEGVRRHLQQMAAAWKGPESLV